jgi:hypothetical protein
MIQHNTAVSETVLRASGGYHFHVVNDCSVPEEIRCFEKPGMMTINLSGIRLGGEQSRAFVNDLEDPINAPFFG